MKRKVKCPSVGVILAVSGIFCMGVARADWVTLTNFSLWASTYNADIIRITGLSPPLANPGGCTDLDSYMVLSTLTKETKARIYSTLLTAKALGKPVKIWVNGCESARPAIETAVIE